MNFNTNLQVNEKNFLGCSWYFSRMHMYIIYIVVEFQIPSYNTFPDVIFF